MTATRRFMIDSHSCHPPSSRHRGYGSGIPPNQQSLKWSDPMTTMGRRTHEYVVGTGVAHDISKTYVDVGGGTRRCDGGTLTFGSESAVWNGMAFLFDFTGAGLLLNSILIAGMFSTIHSHISRRTPERKNKSQHMHTYVRPR